MHSSIPRRPDEIPQEAMRDTKTGRWKRGNPGGALKRRDAPGFSELCRLYLPEVHLFWVAVMRAEGQFKDAPIQWRLRASENLAAYGAGRPPQDLVMRQQGTQDVVSEVLQNGIIQVPAVEVTDVEVKAAGQPAAA